MSEPFLAEIRMWGCNYAPRGWADCNGGLLSIAQHTALFSVIGTIYGGDGRTTMGLPHLSGRVPMQWGAGPGLSNHAIGELGGSAGVALEVAEIPQHDHIISGVIGFGTSGTPNANMMMGVDAPVLDNILYLEPATTGANATLSPSALGTSGASAFHENRQPFLGVNFCIAIDGLYPQRQ